MTDFAGVKWTVKMVKTIVCGFFPPVPCGILMTHSKLDCV